jgi:hypothetical protein
MFCELDRAIIFLALQPMALILRGCLVYAHPSHAKLGVRQFFGEGFARPDLASA